MRACRLQLAPLQAGFDKDTLAPAWTRARAQGAPIREVLKADGAWLDGEFVDVVQQRGAAIIKVRVSALPPFW